MGGELHQAAGARAAAGERHYRPGAGREIADRIVSRLVDAAGHLLLRPLPGGWVRRFSGSDDLGARQLPRLDPPETAAGHTPGARRRHLQALDRTVADCDHARVGTAGVATCLRLEPL